MPGVPPLPTGSGARRQYQHQLLQVDVGGTQHVWILVSGEGTTVAFVLVVHWAFRSTTRAIDSVYKINRFSPTQYKLKTPFKFH